MKVVFWSFERIVRTNPPNPPPVSFPVNFRVFRIFRIFSIFLVEMLKFFK